MAVFIGLKGNASTAPMNFRHISSLLRYCVRRFPLFHVALALSLLSIGIELGAMSALFPLAEFAAGRRLPESAVWPRILAFSGLSSNAHVLLAVLFALLFLRTLTLLISNVLIAWLHRQLVAHFSSQAFSTFIRTLTFTEVNDRGIGYFINLAGDEANRTSQIIISLARLVPVTALSALYFFGIAYKSPWVALAVLLFMGTAGLSLMGALRRSHSLGMVQREESHALNSHFMDSFNSLRSVRALTAEDFVVSRYRAMIAEYARTCFRVDRVNYLARFMPILALLALGIAWVVAYSGSQAVAENLPLLLVILVLLLRFFPVLGESVDVFMKVVTDLKVSHDITYILEQNQTRELVRQADREERVSLGPIQSLELKEVDFSYSQDRPVLNDASMHLKAGCSYMIVGPSGAGKSTIVDLLLRFYDISHGAITINGRDIHEFDPADLRQKIVVVEQHARVFNDTVLNNIAFGRSVSLAQVRQACALACIDEDIMKFPQGYETVISYQGGNLSGGQRQRIALARGLLTKADVLILDEATNALDEKTRNSVVRNILAEYQSRIVVFVTHDLSLAEQVTAVIHWDNINDAPQKNRDVLSSLEGQTR